MSTIQNEYILLDQEYLEPYLKLPSGLPLVQAKQNAKLLKKSQNISHAEALKIVCWGNGLTDVRDFSQAIPLLIRSTFGLSHDEFGLIRHGNEFTGYWIKQEQWSTYPGCCPQEYKEAAKELMAQISENKNYKNKSAKFLKAVKDCIKFLGDGFYTTKNRIPISEVTEASQIEIDLDKLLKLKGSDGENTMAYILASCYNYRYTAAVIAGHSLLSYSKRRSDTCFNIAKKSDRDSLASCYYDFAQFGLISSILDENNKRIVSELLLNYEGWSYLN